MNRYKQENLVALHNGVTGVLYDVPTGTVFQVSPQACDMVSETQKSVEDDTGLEDFMLAKLADKKDLPIYIPDALNRGELAKLTIMVATSCNLQCTYCYADGGDYGYGCKIMTPEQIKEYLYVLIPNRIHHITQVTFFGGEPLLSVDTIAAACETFSLLVEEGYLQNIPAYGMVTNLTLLDDRIMDVLQTYNIGVTVSIDGPENLHDANRVYKNGQGSWKKVRENISKLTQRGLGPDMLEATYTRAHFESGWTLENIRDYLHKETGVVNIIVSRAYGGEGASLMDIHENKETYVADVKQYLDDVIKEPIAIDVEKIHSLCGFFTNAVCDVHCSAGLSTLAVMPDGALYPCHFFCVDASFCMGTIEAHYEDFVERVKIVQKKLISISKQNNPECKNCWVRNACVQCPASTLKYGTFGRYSADGCAILREEKKKTLLYMADLMKEPERWKNALSQLKKMHTESVLHQRKSV